MKIDSNTSLKNNKHENSLTKTMKNLFDSGICVDCGKSCHLGSGRGFNRYAVYTDEYEGWRCGDCAEEVDALLEELKND